MNKSCLEILPEDFQINLDTVKFSVSNVKIEFNDVTRMLITSAEGEMSCMKTNRKPLRGVFDRHALQMRYITKENEESGDLIIEGSLFGNRYGQNVHTSANMRNACIWTLKRVRDLHQLQTTPESAQDWNAGLIQLHRVDLAVNFKLESGDQVDRALTQLKRQFAAQRVECHLHDTYASFAPRGGKNYSIATYAKGAQMRVLASRSKNDETLARLAEECAPILRVELRLQKPELRRLKLDEVGAWSAPIARSTYRKYFARLPLDGMTFGLLKPDDLRDVDVRMRPVLAHHKLGTDPKLIYSDRTRARHKAYFKQLGIDLNVPNEPTQPVLLTDILSKRGTIMKTPRWLTEAGRAPLTKERNAT